MAGNLYIKYGAGDMGARPIPANTPFWATPSIWLNNTPGNNTATVGVDNPISVQVDRMNGAAETGTAYVQTWVTKSTTQPGPSGAVLTSAGGSGGLSQVIVGPTSYPQVATMDWTPVSGEQDQPNVFHHCVAANVYIALGDPEGGDLTTGFIDPVNNQHHGQLNISIVTAPGPQRMIRFPFRAPAGVNLFAEQRIEETVVRVKPLSDDLALSGVIQEHLLGSPLIELLGAKEVPWAPAECLTEPRERTMLRGGGELVLARSERKTPVVASEKELREIRILAEGSAAKEWVLKPMPGVIVPMAVELELPEDRAGAVHEFDITQSTAAGRVLGGIRVVIVRGHHWW